MVCRGRGRILSFTKAGKDEPEDMVEMWKNFVEKYPIISIEDGMAEGIGTAGSF